MAVQDTEAHADHDRLVGPGQCGPVQVQRAVFQMTRGEQTGLRVVPVGQRYPGVSGNAAGGGDARYHLKGNTLIGQHFQPLAATTKNKAVATFEANHFFALAGQLDQQQVDFCLGQGVAIGLLANIDFLAPL